MFSSFNKLPRTLSVLLVFFIAFSTLTQAEVLETDALFDFGQQNSSTQSRSLEDFNAEYLEDIQGISVLNFSGNYDKSINGEANTGARQAVLHSFYDNQPDSYDFVFIFTEFDFDSGEADAFATTIMNDVNGIGINIFDNRASYQSEKLQIIIDMKSMASLVLNPLDPRYKSLLDIMMHEMMHRWGIFIKYIDEDGQVSDRLLGRTDSHWSYFLNSNASLMYGSLWNEYQQGYFRTENIRHSLSPLDLYLAGFIPKNLVADFFVINNASAGINTDYPPLIGTEIDGDKEIISINDIIAYEGERVPNSDNSQHQFKIKFILLKSEQDEIKSQSIANLYILQNEFQKRFFADTRGIGIVEFPNESSNSGLNNPQVLDFDPQLTSAFDLQSALDFLLSDETTDWWQDRTATKARDTVTTIKSLQLIVDDYPEAQTKISNAILWLNNYQPQNNDEMAWMLSSGVLTNEVEQSLVATLNSNKIHQDGWGIDN
ncbi:hypothetical protein MNBD_GAMMA01-2034 [hydrothermal vent metagenome]|uniref:Uncharacterized protein n=1 Tax=hydrothermal vent metagenome TaxID=652676 RepID=A0A3B0V9U4_9ZZZZ